MEQPPDLRSGLSVPELDFQSSNPGTVCLTLRAAKRPPGLPNVFSIRANLPCQYDETWSTALGGGVVAIPWL
eukprot:3790478-Prymnesium_polylepis.1